MYNADTISRRVSRVEYKVVGHLPPIVACMHRPAPQRSYAHAHETFPGLPDTPPTRHHHNSIYSPPALLSSDPTATSPTDSPPTSPAKLHFLPPPPPAESGPYRTPGGAIPAPIPCNRLASWGYLSCTSNCVRVASAYDSALTISPSVRESSAARSKYCKASVTLPCWRRSCAMVATAMSHSGSTRKRTSG